MKAKLGSLRRLSNNLSNEASKAGSERIPKVKISPKGLPSEQLA
jgi:hypothetical protein